MSTILITGASGTIGREVIRALRVFSTTATVVVGVRTMGEESFLAADSGIIPVHFDFENPNTFAPALRKCTVLFLLRPPHISDVSAIFEPLILAAKQNGVRHVVFLSVQGVENSSLIPHHSIEKLVVQSGLGYTFLRPAYFFQNFTTTFRHDIVHKHQVVIPAGKTKFTVIDAQDIGRVAACVLLNPQKYQNHAFDLTNEEQLTFAQMVDTIGEFTGRSIRYISPNLIQFFYLKRKEKVPVMLILVLIMLHYLPRFQKVPPTSRWVERITGQKPATFADFVARNTAAFTEV
ncbi:NmrA family NAD(P)-binding protein [Arundinibacter roseus]|uniref:NmrA family transcriptional regulator n=1 Tax=Arundinibacter roseus TaxID=2070510 RepID=A0A4R4KHF1_9BACT|nr:NmrA family NAD(P)-binding protein [Arundinibacter roseus]TDB67524.1 NmrA family transcriptional regulator [Arundinibacter roseus]